MGVTTVILCFHPFFVVIASGAWGKRRQREHRDE
jgi:hypothetical protein